MGKPPCCDKVGIKKGPWTPEEDIILVSYIQEHGPGNWRSVPTNTGLLRCSKSCRLRWTNYLRPGIKRGNFTPHEEGMIIHLQALLGNKWAAIASYLPQRTDNDIKNYWNTHLKKKMRKFESDLDPQMQSDSSTTYEFVSKHFRASTSHENGKKQLANTSVYASSAENISRLLQGWMRSSSVPKNISIGHEEELQQNGGNEENCNSVATISLQCYRPQVEQVSYKDEIESILSFENINSFNGKKENESSGSFEKENNYVQEQSSRLENNPPLSFLENWLLDETIGQVGVMEVELPSIF